VLAIPFTLLREVRLDMELPAVKKRAIQELGMGTNAKLMVGFSERVWRESHRSNGASMADLPFQTTWETSRAQPGKAGVITNFTGGEHGLSLGTGTAAEQAQAFVDDFEKVFPGVAAARHGMTEARFHWPSFPWTKGSYACYQVGQWTSFGGAEKERVRNLHFAGEHCSVDFQGFMEGGCETGQGAAAAILEDLGLAQPEAVRKAAGG
jgi:monoamine oxidase